MSSATSKPTVIYYDWERGHFYKETRGWDFYPTNVYISVAKGEELVAKGTHVWHVRPY